MAAFIILMVLPVASQICFQSPKGIDCVMDNDCDWNRCYYFNDGICCFDGIQCWISPEKGQCTRFPDTHCTDPAPPRSNSSPSSYALAYSSYSKYSWTTPKKLEWWSKYPDLIPSTYACKYFHINKKATFKEARKYCQDIFGTDLATINSQKNAQIAAEIIKTKVKESTPSWIGLFSDRMNINAMPWFHWVSGKECDQLTSGKCVLFWKLGQPRRVEDFQGNNETMNNYNGDGYSFVAIDKDGKVDNDAPGDSKRSFLCDSPYPRVPILPLPQCYDTDSKILKHIT